MSNEGRADTVEIFSAFKIVYLFVFGATILDLITVGYRNYKQFGEKYAATHALADVQGLAIILFVFLVVVGLHLFRLYLTLECLEGKKMSFSDYYNTFSPTALRWEFGVRLILVFLISFKALNVVTATPLPFLGVFAPLDANPSLITVALGFLWFLYLFLFIWSMIALLWGKKGIRQSFLPSSLSGLVIASVAWITQESDQLFVWMVVTMVLFIVGLLIDLIFDIIANGYWRWRNLCKILSA